MNNARGDAEFRNVAASAVDASSSLIAAAHELKSPLVLLRQLSFEMQELNSSNQMKLSEKVRLTSERALRLVDNLTKTARLQDAMFELEPVQLNGIFAEVLEEMSPLARALDQKFSLKVAKSMPAVVGNRDLLGGLLVNLLDNSLQYNSSAQAIEISARISRPTREATIAVRDHGTAIGLAEFRHLSESLGRAKQPISARPLSSGLGLFIAGEFARAMKGRLSVTRHRSGGLTFAASLPISHQLSLLEI